MRYVFLLVMLSFISCEKQEAYIPDNYGTWKVLNWIPMDYPVPGHEDRYRVSYINEKGREVTLDQAYPDGSIIVKEIYADLNPGENDKPVLLTAMIKKEGKWIWVLKKLPEGEEQVMDPAFCLTCHDNANEAHPYGDKNPEGRFRDYVFFRRPPGTE